MKKLIFLLLISCELFGQQELFHAQNKGLLLDEYPSAAAAYSLRRVNSRYTGPLIRVRKDSTGQLTQDIGTIGEALDTMALKAFAGANNCYVSIWYDQSGNTGRDATQTTAASQPRIVNAGIIERRNGKPALRFYSGSQSLQSYKFAAPSTNWAFFTLHSADIITGNVYDVYANDGTGYGGSGIYLQLNSIVIKTTAAFAGTMFAATLFLTNFNYFSNNTGIYIGNNTQGSTATFPIWTVGSRSNLTLGQYTSNGNPSLIGNISEHIVYQQDLNLTRTGIRNNINQYYAIY